MLCLILGLSCPQQTSEKNIIYINNIYIYSNYLEEPIENKGKEDPNKMDKSNSLKEPIR